MTTSSFPILAKKVLDGLTRRLLRRRVPVMLQMNAVECGASCLAMILNFYGYQIQVSECRERFKLGRNGTSAREIAEVAQSYGLVVKAFSVEPAQLKQIFLPVIAHWNFSHFVVVTHYSPHTVSVIDPAVGALELTAAEFSQGFTGVVLSMKPESHFRPRWQAVRPLWLLYPLRLIKTSGTIKYLFQIVLASIVLQVAGLGAPLITKLLVDMVLPLYMRDVMAFLAAGIFILVAFYSLTRYLRSVLLIYLQTRLDAHMTRELYQYMLALPLSFFQQRSSGDLLMRLGSNSIVREILMNQALSMFLDGSLTILYLFILFTQEVELGWLTLGISLGQILVLFCSAQRVNTVMQRDLLAQSESQSYLVETLSGIKLLKALGKEDRAVAHWSNLFANQLNISVERDHLAAILDVLIFAVRVGSPLLLLWVGATYVLAGEMSLGTMFALIALASAVLSPLSSLMANGQRLQIVGAQLDRLRDVLDAKPEYLAGETRSLPRLSRTIEFRNVYFQYDTGEPVLRNISFVIESGKKVAIVGETGSGKSTLALLLLGLYLPSQGEILFDGVQVSNLELKSLRSKFGVVLQEPFLFNTSIRNNIAFSNPGLQLGSIMEAAHVAHIHHEIEQMPLQYETLVGEGGAGLSGGQRQRIALAQALANKPEILLLDEATSYLDTSTEAIVDRNLDQLSCTRIVIAHRLSTVCNADQIVVLKDGQVIETGTHLELMRQAGNYFQLFQVQLPKLGQNNAI